MHKFKLSMIFCTLAVTSSTAFAKSNFFDAPYFGVEAIQTNQNYKAGYGKDVFKKNTMNYNIFAGFKLVKFLGIEAGYEIQPNATKLTQLVAGQSFPGSLPIEAGDTFLSNSSISGTHPYVGIFAEIDEKYESWGNVKYQVMLGASFSNIKTSFMSLLEETPTQTTTTYGNISGSKVIPVIKISATNAITNNFGIRVSIDYHNFASIKIQNVDNIVKLKDTFGIGLGLTYSFFVHKTTDIPVYYK